MRSFDVVRGVRLVVRSNTFFDFVRTTIDIGVVVALNIASAVVNGH